jgi:hypothetical protein
MLYGIHYDKVKTRNSNFIAQNLTKREKPALNNRNFIELLKKKANYKMIL